MQKIIKYIIIVVVAVLLFGTGFIAGCSYSNRTTKELEDRNIELQASIKSYSTTVKTLKSEGIKVNYQVRGLNQQIIDLRDEVSSYSRISSDITIDLGSVYGDIFKSRRGIQNVAEGLGRIDSGLQSYIERAENP